MIRIHFASRNDHKIAEATAILNALEIEVIPLQFEIHELQTVDPLELVRDKTLKAFVEVGDRVMVEHTGLHLAHLNGFPGGLTQIFWDTLKADRFAELFGTTNPSVIATTTVGYIDGRRFESFTGSVGGSIVNPPRGPTDFQWDCVFQPDGSAQTFAEMGSEEKNKRSMRQIALAKFAEHLKQGA
jgi:XTP/dITP diphosphohydrolase